ncbi:serine protease [Prauserella muralis]|uniref:Serine protease n=1 Tax=Prauserella muralis TaxID=588067 RepID=A0A2V4B0H6_9PSEU|nr:serine protease [Prauserella muralis]TWE22763.1 subtilase family protein [Prauserella muralis]
MLRRGSVLLTCAVLVFAGQAAAAGGAAAEPGDECTGSGDALRYLVLFDPGTSRAAARQEIAAACGRPTVYYPEIAVAVATSRSPAFAERIGADRTVSAQRLRGDEPTGRTQRQDPDRQAPQTALGSGDLSAAQWDMRAIGADVARAVEPGSRTVVVGVLDSGVDAGHPDLSRAVDPRLSASCLSGAPERSAASWAPTTSEHGTHVAGIIAAADDGQGITGVAPGVRLASVKVVDDQGYVEPQAAVCGFMWAARHGIPITNSSFFVTPGTMPCAPSDGYDVVREAVARAVGYAESAGTLNVAAATNEAVHLTASPESGAADDTSRGTCEALPAGLRDTVAVSAVGRDRVKAGYSSYGLGVIDLAAPGGTDGDCVLSTVPGGYAPLCGTSMAAPHVTGVAALLASREPGASPERLRDVLAEQAQAIACPGDYDLTGNGSQDAYCAGYEGYNGFYGRGMVDALAAVSGSPEQEASEPARRGVDAEQSQRDQVADVPEHRRVEHPGGQSAQELDPVVERNALNDVLQGLGVDRQRVEGR